MRKDKCYEYFTNLKEMVLEDNFCAINDSSDTALTTVFDCCTEYETTYLITRSNNGDNRTFSKLYNDIVNTLSEFRFKIHIEENLIKMRTCLYHLAEYIEVKIELIPPNSYHYITLASINIALNKIMNIFCK